MASFGRIRDNQGWLADREVLDIATIAVFVGDNKVIYGVDFELPPVGAQINRVLEEGGVVEGHFYIIHLDSGLRFSLSGFIRRG